MPGDNSETTQDSTPSIYIDRLIDKDIIRLLFQDNLITLEGEFIQAVMRPCDKIGGQPVNAYRDHLLRRKKC